MEQNSFFTFSLLPRQSDLLQACQVYSEEIPKRVDVNFFKAMYVSKYEDVKILEMRFKKSRIPSGIGNVFPNVISLVLINCGIERICAENFRQFPHLEYLDMTRNKIKYLPGNLFQYNKNIKNVKFYDNSIEKIAPNVLKGCENLEKILFICDRNCFCWYDKNNRDSVTWEELKAQLNSMWGQKVDTKLKATENSQCSVRLHKELDAIFASEKFKDFTIKIESKHFKVHKFLMIASSLKISQMIENNLDVNQLELSDIEADTFENVLKFIYTDEIPKDVDEIRNLFWVSKKLQINSLKKITSEVLMNTKKEEHDLDILMEIFNGEDLKCKHEAFEEMKKYFKGKKLSYELFNLPEKLEKLIDAKLKSIEAQKYLDEQLKEFEDEN